MYVIIVPTTHKECTVASIRDIRRQISHFCKWDSLSQRPPACDPFKRLRILTHLWSWEEDSSHLWTLYKSLGKPSTFISWLTVKQGHSFRRRTVWTTLFYMMPQDCSFLSEWVYPSSGSQSPTSSTGSFLLSPNYPHSASRQEIFAKYLQDPMVNMACHQTEKSPLTGRRSRCKVIGPQRQSASEREKLRMRDLSKALHNLRKYLPPSVVPAGRNLTKIETLRLTINYISYLSKLLGLNEETMKHKREPHQDVDSAYLQVPEAYQEKTCRQHQQSQPQSQSTLFYEPAQQCESFRISPAEPEQSQIQGETWMSPLPYHRSHKPLSDFSISTPYTSRFTDLYQVICFYLLPSEYV